MNPIKPRNTDAGSDSLADRLRAARPTPPLHLEQRCRPSAAAEEVSVIPQWRLSMLNRAFLRGAGGLAAAAAITLAVLALWPGGSGIRAASAEALSAAMQSLDRVDAVRVTSTVDAGPGTPAQPLWTGIALRDVGFRLSGEGSVQIYNHQERRQYTIEGESMRVVELRDATSLGQLLEHFSANQRLQYLRETALRRGATLSDEQVVIDGLAVRRFSAPDENGRPVSLDIDMQTQRLRHCDTWTMDTPDQPAIRQRWDFEYPEPSSIDLSLFAAPNAEGRTVTREPAGRAQCMVNMRNLAMAIQVYATEHEDQLAPGLSDLKRYLPHEDLTELLSCRNDSGELVRIKYHGPDQQPAATLAGLDMPTTILFECELGSGKAVGYVDGHVEYHAN